MNRTMNRPSLLWLLSVLALPVLLGVLAAGFGESSVAPGTRGVAGGAAQRSAGGAPGAAAPNSAVSQRGAEAQDDGQREMRSLAQAYPDRIAELTRREGDWALRIDDTWYYWSKGRLLPEQLRQRWNEYTSYRFYNYSFGLPPLPSLDEEDKRRIAKRIEQAESSPPLRHGGFLGDLYRAETRSQTEARIVTVSLMGFEVRVHERLVGPLAAVDRRVEELARNEPEIRRFLAGLKEAAGYNWREIAGTRSRSYHSYGLAVDLIPKSYGGRHTYWRWAMAANEEWYAIPYEQRWMVPRQVVQAFEEQGFIWGGKWLYFDTMHFEYRPEIIILARRNAAGDQR